MVTALLWRLTAVGWIAPGPMACAPPAFTCKDISKACKEAPADRGYLTRIHEGCEKRFGRGSCAVKVVKQKEGSYHVICRKEE